MIELEPERAPTFEPIDFTTSEQDNIARQDSDAASWYRSLPYNGRP